MKSDELRQLETDQAWLAGFHTPAPTDQAIARTKTLLRQELARRSRVWRIGPAKGFWAAAAMLTLSVGLVWQARIFSLQSGPVHGLTFPLQVTFAVDPDEAVLSSLAGEVSEIGSTSSLASQTPLDGLMDDVQDLETESKALWDTLYTGVAI